jgi:carboxyl-terminal processing protease
MANLRNLSGEGVLLHDGRFDLASMAPGDVRRVAFTFDVEPQLSDSEAVVSLSVRDDELREGVDEKLHIPIVEPLAVAPSRGIGIDHARGGGAELRGVPDVAGRVFARLAPGTAAYVLGTVNGFVKLALGDGRFAFARPDDLEPGGSPAPVVAIEDAMAHAPPVLEIPQPRLATAESHTLVYGVASDDARLLDAFIFVGARKVFYRSNRDGADPRHMAFDADLPLRPGVNVVSVIARENPDTTTRRTFIVRRDGPGGELLPTPKTDDELSETGGSEDE